MINITVASNQERAIPLQLWMNTLRVSKDLDIKIQS